MTDKELEEIQKRCDSASSGPWRARGWNDGPGPSEPQEVEFPDGPADQKPYVAFPREGWRGSKPSYVARVCCNGNGTDYQQDNRNAAFIAACRQDVPRLLAYVRELQNVIHDLTEDGYERSRAGRYRRALQEILADVSSGYHGAAARRIAAEALGEDGQDG